MEEENEGIKVGTTEYGNVSITIVAEGKNIQFLGDPEQTWELCNQLARAATMSECILKAKESEGTDNG